MITPQISHAVTRQVRNEAALEDFNKALETDPNFEEAELL